MNDAPPSSEDQLFTVVFAPGETRPALRCAPHSDPARLLAFLGLDIPRPAIFLSGGAGAMSEEELARTRQVVEEGLVSFAQEEGCLVIDGGTDSGVMQMLGDARRRSGATFPLLGVAPAGRVRFPGHERSDADAELHAGHSHFGWVPANAGGDKALIIFELPRAPAAGVRPMLGVLINGGKIAQKDVWLATAQGEQRIPVVVLEGSGRAADEVARATRTGQSDSDVIKAIVDGGEIHVASLRKGPDGLRAILRTVFRQHGHARG